VQLLAQSCDLTEEEVHNAATKGAVWRVKAGSRSKPRRIRDLDGQSGSRDLLMINYNRRVLEEVAGTPELVGEDRNYSVWCKPQGMLCQGSKWSDHTTITYTVAEKIGKPCYLVHRLDRATRGLILLAHTKNAQVQLSALFESRKVEKTYCARVHGVFDKKLPHSIKQLVDGKDAVTIVTEAQKHADEPGDESITELRLKIKTGRKHQIRVHLSGLGFPVVGDRLCDPERQHSGNLQLAASELQFDCPFSGKPRRYQLAAALE